MRSSWVGVRSDAGRLSGGGRRGHGATGGPAAVKPPFPGYRPSMATTDGVPASELSDEDLFRELGSLHRTRLDTLRHAPDDALAVHLARTTELEGEYLLRRPLREIDPSRLTITSRS